MGRWCIAFCLSVIDSCTNCGCVIDENPIVNNVEFVGNGEGASFVLFSIYQLESLVKL